MDPPGGVSRGVKGGDPRPCSCPVFLCALLRTSVSVPSVSVGTLHGPPPNGDRGRICSLHVRSHLQASGRRSERRSWGRVCRAGCGDSLCRRRPCRASRAGQSATTRDRVGCLDLARRTVSGAAKRVRSTGLRVQPRRLPAGTARLAGLRHSGRRGLRGSPPARGCSGGRSSRPRRRHADSSLGKAQAYPPGDSASARSPGSRGEQAPDAWGRIRPWSRPRPVVLTCWSPVTTSGACLVFPSPRFISETSHTERSHPLSDSSGLVFFAVTQTPTL